MKSRFFHPLWTHLPALGALVFIIAYTIAMGPLPSSAPTHWDFHGNVDNYGSPYLGFGITVGLSVLYIGIGVLFDELWAKQEKKKRFNWFSLFDEIIVGFLVGIYAGYLQYLKSGGAFSFPWVTVLITIGVLVLAALILDKLRPFRPKPEKASFTAAAERVKELSERLKGSGSFVHWESQNPWWISLLSLGLTVAMLIAAVFAWFSAPWASLVLLIAGFTMLFMYGGLQTTVTRQEIIVGFGILGTKVLRLKTDEIQDIELAEFSPIADFGGYGIRWNGKMWAYYMQGTKGVKLTTVQGKKYIIGSDQPEELYAVVQAVAKGQGV